MKEESVRQILSMVSDKLPEEKLMVLKNKLYFDVSVDYLLGREEEQEILKTSSVLTAEEISLLAGYRKLGKLGKSS